MRFDTSQHMRLGQHMKLAPRMIQSMEILQMPLLQLEERIAQELESNATLEMVEGADLELAAPVSDGAVEQNGVAPGVEREQPMTIDEQSGAADFERLESFESELPDAAENEFSEAEHVAERREELPWERPLASGGMGGDPDAKSEAMANTAARAGSIQDQLREQWRLSEVEASLIPIGELIISFIEDDGYLRTPLETIADRTPTNMERPTPEQLERALQAVQILIEPPGIAARDLKECLLLQVDALEAEESIIPAGEDAISWAIVRRLIENHLDDLAQNRLPRVVEKSGLTLPQLKLAIEKMRHLTVAPGRQLVTETPPAIIPDAIIEHDADRDKYIAYLNDTRLPNLRINQEYAKLSKDRTAPKETREFLKKNLSNAAWLIDAVDQRRNTLLRVINVVVDAQRDYFDYGPQALRPLPMTQVADQLGIHVATVSRAVADKYVLTPRGVVPLRGFFSGGTQTESGEDVSWDAVKAALKEVIDAEDKSNPLSDDALAEEVGKRGIEIARRTVAKYRGQLGIPSARLRKQF
jgi:RNA polymerase sigma-54 factor